MSQKTKTVPKVCEFKDLDKLIDGMEEKGNLFLSFAPRKENDEGLVTHYTVLFSCPFRSEEETQETT